MGCCVAWSDYIGHPFQHKCRGECTTIPSKINGLVSMVGRAGCYMRNCHQKGFNSKSPHFSSHGKHWLHISSCDTKWQAIFNLASSLHKGEQQRFLGDDCCDASRERAPLYPPIISLPSCALAAWTTSQPVMHSEPFFLHQPCCPRIMCQHVNKCIVFWPI